MFQLQSEPQAKIDTIPLEYEMSVELEGKSEYIESGSLKVIWSHLSVGKNGVPLGRDGPFATKRLSITRLC